MLKLNKALSSVILKSAFVIGLTCQAGHSMELEDLSLEARTKYIDSWATKAKETSAFESNRGRMPFEAKVTGRKIMDFNYTTGTENTHFQDIQYTLLLTKPNVSKHNVGHEIMCRARYVLTDNPPQMTPSSFPNVFLMEGQDVCFRNMHSDGTNFTYLVMDTFFDLSAKKDAEMEGANF